VGIPSIFTASINPSMLILPSISTTKRCKDRQFRLGSFL
jgi:hypothetical protein